MELTVQVFNINKGHNPEMAAKSVMLDGYEKFIATVREYEKTLSRSEAIERAIDDCVKENILKQFLNEHSSEVRNMLLTEWNTADALRVREEEAMQKTQEIIFSYWRQGLSIEEAQKRFQTMQSAKGKICY